MQFVAALDRPARRDLASPQPRPRDTSCKHNGTCRTILRSAGHAWTIRHRRNPPAGL